MVPKHGKKSKTSDMHLYDDIKSSFSLLKSEELESDYEAGHGRIEKRKYSIITNLKHISGMKDWKDFTSIIKVESERIIKKTGESSRDIRYYISSNNDKEKIANGIRCHWGIENKLHWVLDVVMDEDKSAKRKGFVAQNFSMAKKLTLNLLRKDERKISIRRKQKIAGWKNESLLSILGLIEK